MERLPAYGLCLVVCIALGAVGAEPVQGPYPATGPLRVLKANPRYFTDGSGRAIYLTGSHIWQDLKDLGASDPPPVFDYGDYLDRMKRYNHNFIRLWTWELARYQYRDSKGKPHFSRPFPWPRTGPGKALDGKPRFDLTKFDPSYFDRLRARVIQARDAGLYVSVMLFEGHGVQCSDPPWCWDGHPFNKANNTSGLDGNPNGDERGTEIHTLEVPAVTRVQEAYVRQVVRTVNDLDNVLYEIANEAGAYSTEWQYHMIRFVKACEKDMPKQHPVGMTFQYKGGRNKALFESPADWVSPGPSGGYRDNPPAADGSKVILSDTDHLWGHGGSRLWVWKSFLRGMNPIYMDDYPNWFTRPSPTKDEIRKAMGHTLACARKVNLAKLTPQNDLVSTRYCLADPGVQYIVLQPNGGRFTVALPKTPRSYTVTWIDVATGASRDAPPIEAAGATRLAPLFDGPVVLLLKAAGN